MSTLSEREAILRRALHAAADGIEPGGDGLQRIQSRLGRPRPLALAWAEAVWTDIILRAPGGFQSASEWVANATRVAWERFGPTSGSGGGRAARTFSWLRPLAALGVTVAIVAAGAYVALDAQQAIFPSNASSANSSGGNTGSGGGGNGGSGNVNTQSSAPVGGVFPFGGSSTSRNCASAKPSASPSPGIGAINPPSPTPSTSASQGGSDSPSASASDSSSPNPTAGTNAPSGGTTSASTPPVSGGSSPANASQSPKPKVSPSPCARKTVTRNSLPPPLGVNPQTQASPPAVQVSPSAGSPGSASPAALGLARLEVTG